MLKQVRRVLGDFIIEGRGNVAILFGFALIPLVIGMGAAVDYGRALLVRERMADAADGAALAIGSWPDLTQAEQTAKAQQFFDANYPPSTLGTVGKLNVSYSGDDITVGVSGTVKTTFMNVANIDHIDVGVTTTVTKKQRNIELVLVLDTTGSMADNGKLGALKTAAKQLVSNLFNGNATSDTLKIGVVPFAAAVNIGSNQINSGWLDTATYTAANATADPIPFEDLDKTTGIGPLALYSSAKGLTNRTWAGCVRERGGAYALTDDPPSTGTPATLWAPYFAPDEPDSASKTTYPNTYLCDNPSKCSNGNSTTAPSATCVTGTSTNDQRQCYTTKYKGKSVPSTSTGPDFNCPPAQITPMTNTASTVNAAIDALVAKGSTVIPAGLLWGWRVISPTAPFTEGAAYSDDKWVKAIVLLTDGQNDVGGGGSQNPLPSSDFNHSFYNAFGFAKNGHMGSTSGSNAEATLDSDTITVCGAIKAKGIALYTIGLGVTSASQTLLTSCASSPDKYYNSPTPDQLASIFQDIAQGLGDLRVAQ
jgi:Flp pilus assembly protein TadG